MSFLKHCLQFLRLVDQHDGLISLTNVALIVAIWKLATAPAAGPIDLGGLMLGLAAYNAKKFLNRDADK